MHSEADCCAWRWYSWSCNPARIAFSVASERAPFLLGLFLCRAAPEAQSQPPLLPGSGSTRAFTGFVVNLVGRASTESSGAGDRRAMPRVCPVLEQPLVLVARLNQGVVILVGIVMCRAGRGEPSEPRRNAPSLFFRLDRLDEPVAGNGRDRPPAQSILIVMLVKQFRFVAHVTPQHQSPPLPAWFHPVWSWM